MDNLFNLKGKIAIVTGAGRGLGKAIALGLAGAGASIVVSDVIDTAETVAEVQKLGVKVIGVKTDVTKKKDIEDLVKTAIKTFGKIDILVNNAGVVKQGSSEDISEKDWDLVISVNLKGEFMCAQEVGKQMIKQKSGSIINIASVAGILGSAQTAAYCASKAGVILMTKTMAVEWGKYGIRVNAICPGLFVTDMTKDMIGDPNFMQMIKTRVALARCGNPQELAGTAVYLASDASSYTTGHALVADGGWTAGL